MSRTDDQHAPRGAHGLQQNYPGSEIAPEDEAWARFVEVKKRHEGVRFPSLSQYLRWAKLFIEVYPGQQP